MTAAEKPYSMHGEEGLAKLEEEAEANVDALVELLQLPTDQLLDKIRNQHPQSKKIDAAFLDLDILYDERTHPATGLEDIQLPLVLALALPSEKQKTHDVTTIRLLVETGNLKLFKLREYGRDVQRGVLELYQANDETDSEYLRRLQASDRSAPHLKLVSTEAKRRAIHVVRPTLLPDTRFTLEEMWRYPIMMNRYEESLPYIVGKGTDIWQATLRHAIARGRQKVAAKP